MQSRPRGGKERESEPAHPRAHGQGDDATPGQECRETGANLPLLLELSRLQAFPLLLEFFFFPACFEWLLLMNISVVRLPLRVA